MTKTSGSPIASDGFPARPSGDWARDKLYYVGRYLTIFNKGMYKKWPRRFYVDLMAGPGRCITTEGHEFDGSPLLAVASEPPFEKCIFIESAPKLVRALRARTDTHRARVRIESGDCNSPATITKVRAEIPLDSLTVAFVDNLGLDVTFGTIEALVEGRRIDLLITLQVSDLTRNAENALLKSQDPQRFDAFFGSSAWRTVVRRCRAENMSAQEVASELTRYYMARLETLGYSHVTELHVLMKNTKNAPLYRLVLAARHDRATEFFKEISKIEHSGQRGFRFE